MFQLPNNEHLPIHKLVACFNNTSATYKFYWLLSITEQVEMGRTMIAKKELFAGMLSHSWYTIHYFHVSFGTQDVLQESAKLIRNIENIPITAKKHDISEHLNSSNNRETLKILNHFDLNVPHWFLSPWFPGKSKKDIYELSQDFSHLSLYALHKEFISVNLLWANYIKDNAALIKSFCYWRLSLWLQSKNPNVPDIPNKLIKPAQRNSLTKQRKEYWDLVITEIGALNCIYSNKSLQLGTYAVEHFVPYSFVSHDLIWNLIPADPIFNGSKSDKLPPLSLFFDSFFDVQKQGVDVMKTKYPRNKQLEDYLTIFPDLNESFTKEKMKENIQPLITIASNNGFEYMTI
jgi:hypothetical protein